MKVYAHRGSSLIWPENTMFAFNRAHEHGATGFETDLRLSRDGEIVLAHDGELRRFGHPGQMVSQMTAGELGQLEIPSPDGTCRDRLTTLRRLLDVYPEHDYIFDCKISDEALFITLRELLSDLNLHKRIWFLTWSARADAHVRKHFPDCAYFPRARRTLIWGWASLVRVGRLFEPANKVLSLPAYHRGMPVITPAQIASIKRRGKVFVGYLVNSEREFGHCLACGVEIILTDRPDLVAERSA